MHETTVGETNVPRTACRLQGVDAQYGTPARKGAAARAGREGAPHRVIEHEWMMTT